MVTNSGVAQIGDTAGVVWHFLEKNGPVSMAGLAKKVDAPRDVVMQAVGWLAREGKVLVTEKGRSRMVSLR
jgi:predicted transcriptional regulator